MIKTLDDAMQATAKVNVETAANGGVVYKRGEPGLLAAIKKFLTTPDGKSIQKAWDELDTEDFEGYFTSLLQSLDGVVEAEYVKYEKRIDKQGKRVAKALATLGKKSGFTLGSEPDTVTLRPSGKLMYLDMMFFVKGLTPESVATLRAADLGPKTTVLLVKAAKGMNSHMVSIYVTL